MKVVRVNNKKKSDANVVVEVDPMLFNTIIKKCFTCSKFGHLSKNCTASTTCLKCASNYGLKDCESDIYKCINCIDCNSRYKTNHDVRHTVFDQYTEKEEDIVSGIRKITLKNVIYWISRAWDSVGGSTIKKTLSKVLDIGNYDSEDDSPLNDLALKWSRGEMSSSNFDSETEEEQQNLFELMQNLKSCENVTRQDVDEWVTANDLKEEVNVEELRNAFQETEKSDDDDNEAVDEQPPTKISHQECFASLEKGLRYIEQQSEATPAVLLLLNRWRNMAARKRRYETEAHR
ncbi:Zinc knuckle [Popillia japonica]|uniref:Zinc knuckle n=1 Tax=Popillia japonica TaxID=7064 RepID=A0AAW1LTV3_POPJA